MTTMQRISTCVCSWTTLGSGFILAAAAVLACASSAVALSSRLEPGPARELPSGILQVAPSENGERARHVLVAEKATQTLYVYEFSARGASLVRAMPCTTGKVKGDKQREGDLKTPNGAYWFSRRIDGAELPPLYGAGAFVMDYPNQFDVRAGKTGGGIWLHGVETNDRAYVANDTRGCVAIRNDHFEELRPFVRLRDTPILVIESLELEKPSELAREASAVGKFIEGWRSAWESRDLDAYMAAYDDDFRVGALDIKGWERQKRDIAQREGERRVAIDSITVLRERDRVWATFRQEYSSATHQDIGVKTLSLVRAGTTWRILGEGWRELNEPFRLLTPSQPTAVTAIASATPERPAVLLPAEEQEKPAVGRAEAEAELAATAAIPEGETAALVVAVEPPVETSTPTPVVTESSTPVPVLAPRPTPVALASAARIAKGPYRLAAPWARVEGESIVVMTQLISSTPSTTRSGTLLLKVKTAKAPERDLTRDRFSLRQGRDVVATIPAGDLPCSVVVVVLDETGKVLLDQDLIVEMGTAP